MIIYSARASWDDGRICANGQHLFGLFQTAESAMSACEKYAQASIKWRDSQSGRIEKEGESSDGWKTYYITKMDVQP